MLNSRCFSPLFSVATSPIIGIAVKPCLIPSLRIYSTAFSKSSPLLLQEPRRFVYPRFAVKDLEAELSKRNRNVAGRKAELIQRLASGDVSRARSLYTAPGNQRKQAKSIKNDSTPITQTESSTTSVHLTAARKKAETKAKKGRVPLIPRPEQLDVEPKRPVRVPINPDNVLARYHRREVVPEVATPQKPVISTVSGDMDHVFIPATMAEIFDPNAEFEIASSEQKTPEPSKPNLETPTGPNTKRVIRDLLKEIIDDMLPPPPSKLANRDPIEQKIIEFGDRDEPLNQGQKSVLIAIGGLSVLWYFFGY